MSSVTKTTGITKANLSVKVQTIATIVAIVSAVALPQIVHLIGRATGMGTAFGELLLPMHLPILLVGLLAGPYAGAIAGLLGPVCSFSLAGMPSVAVLPFMMIELCVYGLSAGLLRKTNMPTVGKVLVAQVAGRVCRAVAVAIAFYVLGTTEIAVASVWAGTVNGVTGIALQLIVLPIIVAAVEKMSTHE